MVALSPLVRKVVWGSILGQIKSAQCCQRFATAAMYLRSCADPTLCRGDRSRHSFHASVQYREFDEDLILTFFLWKLFFFTIGVHFLLSSANIYRFANLRINFERTLRHMQRVFLTPSTGDRHQFRDVILFVTHGNSFADHSRASVPARQLRDDGVKVCKICYISSLRLRKKEMLCASFNRNSPAHISSSSGQTTHGLSPS